MLMISSAITHIAHAHNAALRNQAGGSILSEEWLQQTRDRIGPIGEFTPYYHRLIVDLISEIRALRRVYEAGKKLAHQNEVEQAWAWDLLEAIDAYESGEETK